MRAPGKLALQVEPRAVALITGKLGSVGQMRRGSLWVGELWLDGHCGKVTRDGAEVAPAKVPATFYRHMGQWCRWLAAEYRGDVHRQVASDNRGDVRAVRS